MSLSTRKYKLNHNKITIHIHQVDCVFKTESRGEQVLTRIQRSQSPSVRLAEISNSTATIKKTVRWTRVHSTENLLSIYKDLDSISKNSKKKNKNIVVPLKQIYHIVQKLYSLVFTSKFILGCHKTCPYVFIATLFTIANKWKKTSVY